MAQQQIKGATGSLGSGGELDTYVVPGAVIITPYAVSTVFDGSGASGSFLPCLTFKTQTGAVIARCPAPEVASGATAEVSWFPHVAAASSSGSGIQYDVDNTGDWLNVEASGTEGPPGATIIFTADGDGGLWLVDNGAGGLNLLETGGEGISVQNTGSGETDIVDEGPSGIFLKQTSATGHIALQSHGDGGMTFDDTASAGMNFEGGVYYLNDLPTSDPGVSGQLWVSGTVLNVSP